jgi:hypothetical protein
MFHYTWWRAYNKGARVKQYLTHVPASGVLILELSADKGPTAYEIDDHDNYWGRPWIWALLHNYGQRPGMYGDLDMIATRPMQAIQAENSTCVGIGISPEGIEQNSVVYELMLEVAWRAQVQPASHGVAAVQSEEAIAPAQPAPAQPAPAQPAPAVVDTAPVVDVNQWLHQYAARRYGFAGTGSSPDAKRAWDLLYPAAYQKGTMPRFAVAEPLPYHGKPLAGDTVEQHSGEKAAQAWMALMKAATDPLQLAKTASTNGPLLYDLIDLGRQILAETFDQLSLLFSLEFKTKSTDDAASDRVGGDAAGERVELHVTEGWKTPAGRPKSSFQAQSKVEALTAIGKAMLKLLTDLDRLMGTGVSGAFLLGRYCHYPSVRSCYCCTHYHTCTTTKLQCVCHAVMPLPMLPCRRLCCHAAAYAAILLAGLRQHERVPPVLPKQMCSK